MYCCEGTRLRRDKGRKNEVYNWVIEFTSSNPKLIKLFVKFLNEIIKVEKSRLKGQLFIYDDLNRMKLEKYWASVSGISINHFDKTITLVAKNVRYKPNPNGTFKIRYHSKEAFKKLEHIINDVLNKGEVA